MECCQVPFGKASLLECALSLGSIANNSLVHMCVGADMRAK